MILLCCLCRDIIRGNPDVKWESIKGLENAKRLLKEAVVMPIKYPKWVLCQHRACFISWFFFYSAIWELMLLGCLNYGFTSCNLSLQTLSSLFQCYLVNKNSPRWESKSALFHCCLAIFFKIIIVEFCFLFFILSSRFSCHSCEYMPSFGIWFASWH